MIDDFDPNNTNGAYQKCADDGLLLPIGAGSSIPKELVSFPIIAGIKAEEWNGFHDMILWDELYRKHRYLPSGIHGLVRPLALHLGMDTTPF